MRRLLVPSVIAAVLVTGCGSDGGLPAATASALQERVAQVVEAANAGDVTAARTGLAALREDVDAARRLDRISAERAGTVLAAADEVEAGLPRPTPPPAPSPSPEPAPEPAPGEQGGEDKGKGDDGKDEGKGDDEDDDGKGEGKDD